MVTIFETFSQLLQQEKKEEAVSFILDKLQTKELDVLDLYLTILTPALNSLTCDLEDKRLCIWREHVQTAIVRTIVECSYPYIIEKKNLLNLGSHGTAVIICPPEEYHDLGARMVSDFFTICGCNSIFVGSNTPYRDFYNAIDIIKPDFVAISISNYYNLIITKKIIEEIKTVSHSPLKVIVGGAAFQMDSSKYKLIGADYYAKSFDDIKHIIDSEVIS